MRADKLQVFAQAIPDLHDTGAGYAGTCLSCGRATLRLAILGPDQFEPSCPHCRPAQILDAVRAELRRQHAPVNGKHAPKTRDPPSAASPKKREQPVATTPPAPKGITADVLVQTEFKAIRWAVPDMIGEGITVFAGGTKTGKSWFALMTGIAVASGGRMLSQIQVEPGDVLYLALEDNQRRLKSRLISLLGDSPAPARLHLYTDWPVLGAGGQELMESWLDEHPDARLVMVDVLQKIRPPRSKGADPYEEDYRVLGCLKRVADQRGVSILVLHHTRKMVAPDPFDMVAGSVAMSGTPDGIMVLMRQRDEPDATLHFIGRDVVSEALALRWDDDTKIWNLLGKAEEHQKNEERQAIFDVLKTSPQPLGPSEVATILGRKAANVKVLLWKMTQSGDISSPTRGKYHVAGSEQASKEKRINDF